MPMNIFMKFCQRYQVIFLLLLQKKVKAGIKSKYIVSEFASVPQGRKAELKKSGFNKLIEKGLIERKMRKIWLK